MIKGRAMIAGQPTLVLGLSRENLMRLLDDRPIHITALMLAELGLSEAVEILLVGGETEATISAQLGLLPLQPEVAGQKFLLRPDPEP